MAEDEIKSIESDATAATDAHYELRFLKLTNGEDVIGNVVAGAKFKDDSYVIVQSPLKVTLMLDPSTEDAVFGFSPWIPFTECEHHAIAKLSIVTVATVNSRITDLYAKSVEQYKVKAKQFAERASDEPKPKEPLPEDIDIPIPAGKKVWVN